MIAKFYNLHLGFLIWLSIFRLGHCIRSFISGLDFWILSSVCSWLRLYVDSIGFALYLCSVVGNICFSDTSMYSLVPHGSQLHFIHTTDNCNHIGYVHLRHHQLCHSALSISSLLCIADTHRPAASGPSRSSNTKPFIINQTPSTLSKYFEFRVGRWVGVLGREYIK